MATLPYNPTRILSSTVNVSNFVYVFQPPTTTSTKSQLLALIINGTLESANIPFTTISDPLPFLDDGDGKAFTPTIDAEGFIRVYAGKCQDGAGGSTLWKFTPRNGTNPVDGAWTQMNLTNGGDIGVNGIQGANFLASGIAFSSMTSSNVNMFVFGGMCPTTPSASLDSWTQSANYSNAMVTIEAVSSPSTNIYRLGNSTGRGPPIAEAGFTITPLEPTFSQPSEGDPARNRNQNYVLLGGHTQQAFINMSQVALFSLPEQTWSFLPVDSPSNTPKTDLAARTLPAVEPRSGHTAVLTPDGRQVVVFGGWVGDVATSANPQLAVLELGEGYGGIGDWQWNIPDQAGIGLDTGVGLFGHGAVMLPGSVMMIIGGYLIPQTGKDKTKRNDPLVNSTPYFFNVTSRSWIPSYTHPRATLKLESPSGSASHGITAVKKVGLTAGLTLGILALVLLSLFYLWYNRRLRLRKEAREKDLRSLAVGAHRINSTLLPLGFPGGEMTAVEWMRERSRSSTNAYPWVSGAPGSMGERAGWREGDTEAERTGLLFEIPSPTRGLRRSLHSRGTYQPAPRHEDGRRGHGSSSIHPIDERDEYEEDGTDDPCLGKTNVSKRQVINIIQSAPILDPFRDPGELSRTPSPESPTHARELEVRTWVSDWAAADALMHQQAGRISPDKTDRTSSTLSEKSTRSNISAYSFQQAGGSVGRSVSQRSAVHFNSNPVSAVPNPTTIVTPHLDQQGATCSPLRLSHGHRRSRSLTLFSNSQRQHATDTFTTATTSFSQLQREGEALLDPPHGPPGNSPTRTQRLARGWMGSVRRAFAGADRSPSVSPKRGEHSASSSPTRYHHTGDGVPRRAVSAGAMLWKKRQGARDWDVEDATGGEKRSDSLTHEGDDEEWDIESAVERRVVQVMFTVPREKLRVVNGGPEGDEESFVSTEVRETAQEDHGTGKGKEKEQEMG